MSIKIISVAVAALAATAISLSAQNSALAYCRGCAVGAGVIGGMAAGALIGSAIANSQADAAVTAPSPPAPGMPPPDVSPYDAYDSAACHVERQQVWDGHGWRWTNTEVCD